MLAHYLPGNRFHHHADLPVTLRKTFIVRHLPHKHDILVIPGQAALCRHSIIFISEQFIIRAFRNPNFIKDPPCRIVMPWIPRQCSYPACQMTTRYGIHPPVFSPQFSKAFFHQTFHRPRSGLADPDQLVITSGYGFLCLDPLADFRHQNNFLPFIKPARIHLIDFQYSIQPHPRQKHGFIVERFTHDDGVISDPLYIWVLLHITNRSFSCLCLLFIAIGCLWYSHLQFYQSILQFFSELRFQALNPLISDVNRIKTGSRNRLFNRDFRIYTEKFILKSRRDS